MMRRWFSALSRAERIGLLAWAGLTVLQVVWHAWWLPPTQVPTVAILVLTVVPLLLPLLAMRRVRRALLWVGMLSLFYFCHGVAEAWSAPDARLLAWIEIVLTLAVIGALGTGAMVRRRH